MNIGYAYKDGKALIIDENDKQRVVEYYDNLAEVLSKENLIEEIEKEIETLEEKTGNFKEQTKKQRFLDILMPFVICTGAPLVMFPIVFALLGVSVDLTKIPSVFSGINPGLYLGIVSTPVFSALGGIFSTYCYVTQKNHNNAQKGRQLELSYLKEKLDQEKKELEKLISDSKKNSNDKEDSFYISKVDDKENLKNLRQFMNLYFSLGYDEKRYLKHYKEGNLSEYLSEECLEAANQYFKEKGPTLGQKKY